MSTEEIKQAIETAKKFSDQEIKFAFGRKADDCLLARDGFIDHLYTLLGFGSYTPYLERAGVIREEKEDEAENAKG